MGFGLGRMTLTSLGPTVTTDQVEWAQAGVRWGELEVLALGTLGVMWPLKGLSVG